MERIDHDLLVSSDPEVVDCVLGDGSALLNLRTNIYYSLNEVGTYVWNAIGQPVAFGSLVQRVAAEYAAPADQVEKDLARLVARLDQAGLVTCSHR
jgi:hypothetical protein